MNQVKRIARHKLIRHRVTGSSQRPRVCVYRGLKHLYVQVIDDTTGTTLIGLSDTKSPNRRGLGRAEFLANELVKQLQSKSIQQVVFDRAGFAYHGQVKAIAETLRAHGLLK